jgi:indole-3-glycerol phosphate synthase
MELKRFREAKEAEIARLRQNPPDSEKRGQRSSPDFLAALTKGAKKRGLAFIAEYKRASPSLGDIDLSISPHEAAKAYAAADAISVLTEETFFKGHLGFVRELAVSSLPILRKDFVFDPLQVLETAQTPAAAILLIVRLTPDLGQLTDLVTLSRAYGLLPVVEIFAPAELELARRAGAKVIQVNARDLETLALDGEGRLKLIASFPPLPGEFWIAASGLSSGQDLALCQEAGFKAALIGSKLMGSGSPQIALNKLIEDFESLKRKQLFDK